MSHKYRPGQNVLFSTRVSAASSRGAYKIVRSLPVENDDRLRYRIKSPSEAFERIAEEHELSGME